jgi:hypothetical protein
VFYLNYTPANLGYKVKRNLHLGLREIKGLNTIALLGIPPKLLVGSIKLGSTKSQKAVSFIFCGFIYV